MASPVLPAIALLLLGARFRTLGFEKGYRSLEVTGLWNFLPVMFRRTLNLLASSTLHLLFDTLGS